MQILVEYSPEHLTQPRSLDALFLAPFSPSRLAAWKSKMVDVEAFAEQVFDPKRWINEACELKPSEENMEKCAAGPFSSPSCICTVWQRTALVISDDSVPSAGILKTSDLFRSN